jgi:hypothetical protein
MTTTPSLPPTDAQVNTMRREVFTAIAKRHRRSHKTRIALFSGAAVLVLGATTAGVVAVQIASVDALNTSFDCYTTTNLADPHGTSAYEGNDRQTIHELSMSERVNTAIETCVAGYNAEPTVGDAERVDVPNPTACVLPDKRLAVLPNKDDNAPEMFCRQIGLVAPTGT